MRLLIGILICLTCSSLLAEQKAERPADNVIHVVSPRYPHRQQAGRVGGTGVFRMFIDFKTGKVTSVAVVKSIGADPLDREAIFALRQWRFKPGKITKADIPITFHASGTVAKGSPRRPRLDRFKRSSSLRTNPSFPSFPNSVWERTCPGNSVAPEPKQSGSIPQQSLGTRIL